MKKIGIDIDNTIFTCKSYLYNLLNKVQKLNKSSHAYKIIDVDKTKKLSNFIRVLHPILNHKKYISFPLAKETINKFYDEGYEIHLISNRPGFSIMAQATLQLLQENDIHFNKLIMGCKNKSSYCNENEIDVLIDDMPVNLKYIDDNITTGILFKGKLKSKHPAKWKRSEYNKVEFSSWKFIDEFLSGKFFQRKSFKGKDLDGKDFECEIKQYRDYYDCEAKV